MSVLIPIAVDDGEAMVPDVPVPIRWIEFARKCAGEEALDVSFAVEEIRELFEQGIPHLVAETCICRFACAATGVRRVEIVELAGKGRTRDHEHSNADSPSDSFHCVLRFAQEARLVDNRPPIGRRRCGVGTGDVR